MLDVMHDMYGDVPILAHELVEMSKGDLERWAEDCVSDLVSEDTMPTHWLIVKWSDTCSDDETMISVWATNNSKMAVESEPYMFWEEGAEGRMYEEVVEHAKAGNIEGMVE